ncbi:MAG: HD domain-containing protein [Treponema sp.]|jgi:tRNA nucleotidyltransferase/poly(A) polymerase|nr:HD domain-containing protein [Treponema sp.]
MGIQGIHPVLREMAAIFHEQGKQVFLVGGAVRDLLRGKAAQDWDLATDALPGEVCALFPRVVPTGIKHGTVTVLFKGRALEVTTFRTESDYRDGRRPGQVSFAATIEEDLSRRDLTMNAIALELPSGRRVDPFDGAGDIRNRIIRCVGKPGERFAEDGLRPLRALRFAAQLDFRIEEATLAAIPGAIPTTAKVSAERIRDEIDKIIASPLPSRALRPMEATGLLELLLPELTRCRGVEQKGFHRFDVLDHALLACDYSARTGAPPEVRLAALFHDTGKPACRRLGEGGVWTFYRHEEESARLSAAILRRYRYPNAVRETVCRLIAQHMFHYTGDWTDAAVRRFIIRSGEEHLDDLYRLRLADIYGTAGLEPPPDCLLPLTRRVEAVLARSRALSLRDLAVSGRDLMARGIPAGKRLGLILGELLEAVLEDPALNEREKLLEIAGRLNKR